MKSLKFKPHSTKGFTLIEILVVIALIVALSALGGAGLAKARSKGAKLAAQNQLVALASAINEFYKEYGFLPGGEEISDSEDEVELKDGLRKSNTTFMAALIGKDAINNPKNIVFFKGNDFKPNKGGLYYQTNAKGIELAKLLDPWKEEYLIRLDYDYSDAIDGFNIRSVAAGRSRSRENIKGRKAIVMSRGRDKKSSSTTTRMSKANKDNIYNY